jgi:hypothetical protein
MGDRWSTASLSLKRQATAIEVAVIVTSISRKEAWFRRMEQAVEDDAIENTDEELTAVSALIAEKLKGRP